MKKGECKTKRLLTTLKIKWQSIEVGIRIGVLLRSGSNLQKGTKFLETSCLAFVYQNYIYVTIF